MSDTTNGPEGATNAGDAGRDAERGAESAPRAVTPTTLDALGRELMAIRAMLDAAAVMLDAALTSYGVLRGQLERGDSAPAGTVDADRVRATVDELRAAIGLTGEKKERRFFGQRPDGRPLGSTLEAVEVPPIGGQ